MKSMLGLSLLLALPLLVLACKGDGGGNDEEAVRDTIRQAAVAKNDHDYDQLSQLVTANFYGVEPNPEALEDFLNQSLRIENLEIVSVTVAGDEATAEIARTEHGELIRETMFLLKVSGRWRLDRMEFVSKRGLEDEPGEAPPLPMAPEEEPGPPELTAEEELLASMVLAAEEVDEVFPSLVQIQQVFQGPVSNEDEIKRSIDPEERRAELETYSRVAGYEASYAPAGEEVAIRIELALYATAEGGSGSLKDQLEDQEGSGGFDRFDVGQIGDEAEGGTGESIPGVLGTGILLRVDRVLAIVVVIGSEEDVKDDLRELAVRLADRIQAAIQGQE